MDVIVEVLAKTQATRLDSDDIMYTVSFRLEIEGEPVTFQGQAFIPSVPMAEALWNSIDVGQELTGELT